MRQAFGWVKRILGGERSDVLALLTPQAARTRGPVLRTALAGATVVALGAAAAVGAVAFGALLFALVAIHFLATHVLGLEIDVDPRALYAEMQRRAAAYGPN